MNQAQGSFSLRHLIRMKKINELINTARKLPEDHFLLFIYERKMWSFNCTTFLLLITSSTQSSPNHEQVMVTQKADTELEEQGFEEDLKDDDGSDDDSIDTFNGTHFLAAMMKGMGCIIGMIFCIETSLMETISKNVGILIADFVREDLEGSNEDKPIFVASMDVVNKFKRWHESIPRVRPFYAIKCNDDLNVAKVLASLGSGFDCASIVSN